MKKGVWLLCSIVFILVVLATVLTVPKLTLIGSDILIDLNTDYKELGYKASIVGVDITNNVKVSSNLDTTKIGNYKIIYTVNGLLGKRLVRNVYVREKEAPIITLVGGDKYLCEGEVFTEPGYEVFDNYDGDLKDKVIIDISEDKIVYSVYDSSSNYTSVIRNIYKDDITKPEITLEGNDIYLLVGEAYTEPGYKAYDNCLGDITDKVTVTNDIDNSKIGKYSVTYKVSDNKNETIVTRNVYVTNSLALLGYENKPGTIYLTFDDGPSAYTEKILNILDKYGVKATFFVVPKNSGYYHLIKRAYDTGHSIGIHSLSHNYSYIYASYDNLYNDISSTNEKIKSITGSYTYLYRYPGGSSNTVSRSYTKGIISNSASYLHSLGYHYFDWNISSGDAGGAKTAYQVYSNVINGLSKNRMNVVLMHDIKSYTADAIEDIVKYGIANGYAFSNITMATREVHHSIAN